MIFYILFLSEFTQTLMYEYRSIYIPPNFCVYYNIHILQQSQNSQNITWLSKWFMFTVGFFLFVCFFIFLRRNHYCTFFSLGTIQNLSWNLLSFTKFWVRYLEEGPVVKILCFIVIIVYLPQKLSFQVYFNAENSWWNGESQCRKVKSCFCRNQCQNTDLND